MRRESALPRQLAVTPAFEIARILGKKLLNDDDCIFNPAAQRATFSSHRCLQNFSKFRLSIEIFETLDGQPYFRHFPEHHYRCIRQPQKSIINAVNMLPEYFKAHPYTTVIESDCITSPVQFKPYPTELQFCESV